VTVFVYDASGKLIAEYSTIVETTNAKVGYVTNDHLGSARINTDANGAVASRHDYHPFGEEIATSQRTSGLGYTEDTVRKQFTGYERDDETGLDFAQARMYISTVGRFAGVDPGAFTPADPQNFNRYAHVQNNPIKFIDRSGKDIELTGDDAQKFVDYLEKNTGLKLKYKTVNGVIKITGSSRDRSFTGKVNKEFADLVKNVAGAAGTARFQVSSNIVNGNDKGETVFIDDNETAFRSSAIDSSGNRNIRPGNLNMISIDSVTSQDSDLGNALVGHALIEGLDMREKGANYDLGSEGDTSAHQTGLKAESKILGQRDRRYSPPPPNIALATGDKTHFVYTSIQFDIVVKSNGSASITKVTPPTVKRQ
jgi:RHS repeat-associated protein